MKKARGGFTIVELLAVIGVVAVLISIIVSVASNSIRASRSKRAAVMCSSLQQAISAYYAEEGRWPSLLENVDTDGEDTKTFKGTQADQIFQEVVGKGFGKSGQKSMLLDASGLFVCESAAANNPRARGYNFSEVTGSGAKHRIGLKQMAFGYQDSGSGCFRRFCVIYNCRTDSVTVGM